MPSLTELLFDLDLGSHVVGRTRFCTEPAAAVTAIPTVGGTKQPDIGRLLSLRPTHVIASIDENTKETVDALTRAGVTVIVTHPNAPMDCIGLFRLLGGIFDRPGPAARLESAFVAAYRRLERAAAGWSDRRILYLIWQAPWMTIRPDTFIGQMLSLARLRVLPIAGDDRRYPTVDIDARLLEAVDTVLFPTEPFAFQGGHVEAFRRDWGRPGLTLARIDGSLVSWYGSRAIRGLDYLRECRGQFT